MKEPMPAETVEKLRGYAYQLRQIHQQQTGLRAERDRLIRTFCPSHMESIRRDHSDVGYYCTFCGRGDDGLTHDASASASWGS